MKTEIDMSNVSKEDKHATQEHLIRSIIIENCGKTLTPNITEEVFTKIINEMRAGSCSWAFD